MCQTLLLLAIIMVESSGNPNAVGDNGLAVGILQIHSILVQDVNRIAGTEYTPADRLDVDKSIQMFIIYTNHYTPCWTPELVAKRWNGGPRGERKQATERYWIKVQTEVKNYEKSD